MKVTLTYTEEALQCLALVINLAIKEPVSNLESKLVLATLTNLRGRILKRLINQKDKYNFAFNLDEQIAFCIAYNRSLFKAKNPWVGVILLDTYNSFYPKLI